MTVGEQGVQTTGAFTRADALASATDVLGSSHEAELWLDRPALALDGSRPVDMLRNAEGAEEVRVLLQRLKFGVYT